MRSDWHVVVIVGGDTFRAPKECRAAVRYGLFVAAIATWLAMLDRGRLGVALADGTTGCAIRYRRPLPAGSWGANGQPGAGWHKKDVPHRRREFGMVGCCAASCVLGAPRYAFGEQKSPAVPLFSARARVADVDGEVEALMQEPGLLLGRVGQGGQFAQACTAAGWRGGRRRQYGRAGLRSGKLRSGRRVAV